MINKKITYLVGVAITIAIANLPKAEATVINECTGAILRATKAIPYAKMVIDHDGTVINNDLSYGYTIETEDIPIQICDPVVLASDTDGKGGPGGYRPPGGTSRYPLIIQKDEPTSSFMDFSNDSCLMMIPKGITSAQLSTCRSIATLINGMQVAGKPGNLEGGSIKKLLGRLILPGIVYDTDNSEAIKVAIMNSITSLVGRFTDLLGGTIINEVLSGGLGAKLALDFADTSAIYWGFDAAGKATIFTVLSGRPMQSPKMYNGAAGTQLNVIMQHKVYVNFSPNDMPKILLAVAAGKNLEEIPGLIVSGIFSSAVEAKNSAFGQYMFHQNDCFWSLTGGKPIVYCTN